MVDERNTAPILVIDEAQHLSDAFLLDLSGFLNFAFDSRDLLTLWLVGLPPLARRLHMHQHAALATRITAELRLEPLDRDAFTAAVDHAFKAAGATQKVLSDPAAEMLFRSSRGVLRVASRLLRSASPTIAARPSSTSPRSRPPSTRWGRRERRRPPPRRACGQARRRARDRALARRLALGPRRRRHPRR